MLKDIAELLKAIALLAWPLGTFTTLWMFRREVANVLLRLRKGKLLGQEVELDDQLVELRQQTLQAAAEVVVVEGAAAALPRLPPAVDQAVILEEATRSPKLALIRVAAEIELEIRRDYAATDYHDQLKGRRGDVAGHVERLTREWRWPKTLARSVREFWDIRNRLVHESDASPDDVLRALDSGLTILSTIRRLPRDVHVVYHPGTDVFTDAAGNDKRPDVLGVVIKTTKATGREALEVFPTTRRDYVKGREVAWEWNTKMVVGESWYRNPDNGDIVRAWSSSPEFTGRNIEEIV